LLPSHKRTRLKDFSEDPLRLEQCNCCRTCKSFHHNCHPTGRIAPWNPPGTSRDHRQLHILQDKYRHDGHNHHLLQQAVEEVLLPSRKRTRLRDFFEDPLRLAQCNCCRICKSFHHNCHPTGRISPWRPPETSHDCREPHILPGKYHHDGHSHHLLQPSSLWLLWSLLLSLSWSWSWSSSSWWWSWSWSWWWWSWLSWWL